MATAAAANRDGRKAERVASSARGSMRLAVQLEVVDVTEFGVRVRCAFPVPAGTIVLLGVDGNSRHAKVVWARDGEIGCEFVQPLSHREFERIAGA